MKFLNLGCGNRFFDEWINVDFISTNKNVLSHNLLEGIPFGNDNFDAVYHSHVLEHFTKNDASKFLYECHRVLKKDGIIRIAVPDLEGIVRSYLNNLDNAKDSPTEINQANYEWSILELYDQVVRNNSGGEMSSYWTQGKMINQDFVESRMGFEFLNHRNAVILKNQYKNKKLIKNKYFKYFKSQIDSIKNKLIIHLIGDKEYYKFYKIGKFRSSGEIHQWMYDIYSMTMLLEKIGFKDVRKVDAFTSGINNWEKYLWLDVEGGKVRKPDSLFIEAKK